tara:strand:- start:143 stop:559 length:417 start_codon:yes stop_codon:yes gene_type:complete
MLHTLRKTKAHVSLHYQHSFSNNLYAENIAAEIAETITLSFDLNCNLRGRNKQTNTYVDAKDLADGDIDELETFQFDDKRVIERISEMASRLNATPEIWRLIVQLDGEYRFDVRPEYREQHTYRSITLHVISNARNTK